MSNHPPRAFLGNASRKRKERDEDFDAPKASTLTEITTMKAELDKDNRLLAGYLAHEFITKGTLFGESWDPARAEAAPITGTKVKANGRVEPREVEPLCKPKIYDDVANLLKNEGAQVPGVINPTQLVRWLRM